VLCLSLHLREEKLAVNLSKMINGGSGAIVAELLYYPDRVLSRVLEAINESSYIVAS
jgi:hypothetical protein